MIKLRLQVAEDDGSRVLRRGQQVVGFAVESGYAPCEPRCDFLEWHEAWLDGRPIQAEGFD